MMMSSTFAIGGGGGAVQSPARTASAAPPIYATPFAATVSAAAAAKASVDPTVNTPGARVQSVSESPAAAAAAAAVISLRRSPRLATPTSSSHLDHPPRRRAHAKTLGRADDARHSRIIRMVDHNQRRQVHLQHARVAEHADATAAPASPARTDFVSKFYDFLVSKGKTSQDQALRLDSVPGLIRSNNLPIPVGFTPNKSMDFLKSYFQSKSQFRLVMNTNQSADYKNCWFVFAVVSK